MDDPSRGFRYSSARRRSSAPSPAILAAIAIGALMVMLAVFRPRPEPEVTPAPPTPPSPTPPSTVTPTPTATIAAVEEFSSDWVEVSSPEDTPTPWPTWPTVPAPVRREPTPTPKVSECVTFNFTTSQVFMPSAQVLTEIRARNGCNRDLEPTDLMFEISGWRDGGLVRSVRAMPFNPIRRRFSEIITVGLPGSLDWYDNVTVEILD